MTIQTNPDTYLLILCTAIAVYSLLKYYFLNRNLFLMKKTSNPRILDILKKEHSARHFFATVSQWKYLEYRQAKEFLEQVNKSDIEKVFFYKPNHEDGQIYFVFKGASNVQVFKSILSSEINNTINTRRTISDKALWESV